MTKALLAIRHVAFEDLGGFEEPLTEAGYAIRYADMGADEIADFGTYALEKRSPWFVLAFALSCLLGSLYGFLQGARPFGLVEAHGGAPSPMPFGARPACACGNFPSPWTSFCEGNGLTAAVITFPMF